MLVVFFNVKGIVMTEYIPSGEIMTHKNYTVLLSKVREITEERHGSYWILHQAKATSSSTESCVSLTRARSLQPLSLS